MYHFYEDLSFSDEPLEQVYIQIDDPETFAAEKVVPAAQPHVTVDVPAASMDEIALAWVKKRNLDLEAS